MIEKMELLTLTGDEKLIDRALRAVRQLPEFAPADARDVLRIQHAAPPDSGGGYASALQALDTLEAALASDAAAAKKDAGTAKKDIGAARTKETGVAKYAAPENSDVRSPGTAELPENLSPESARAFIDSLSAKRRALADETAAAAAALRDNDMVIGQLEHLADAKVDLDRLFSVEFFHFRFGHMPRESAENLVNYRRDCEDMFFFPLSTEKSKEVWGLYITPKAHAVRIDNLFSSLGFERVYISTRIHGTPAEALTELRAKSAELKADLAAKTAKSAEFAREASAVTAALRSRLTGLAELGRLKSLCDFRHGTFTMCGWVPRRRAADACAKLEAVEGVTVTVEQPPPSQDDDPSAARVIPPTKLRNFFLFRPFEQYVMMYGCPSYGELDPTPVVAITYMLFFGLMFGDVGQGALLILAGLVMWFWKKLPLGRIISLIGCSSCAFGFFYGSVFGFEDIIEGFNPMENINVTLVAAVALGVATVLACMVLNIVNGIKRRDVGRVLLSPNGVVGMATYCGVVVFALGFFGIVKEQIVPSSVLAAVVVTGLALLFLAEPLTALIRRRGDVIPKDPVDFAFSSFFELFESVLSYLTNTISFIRIGAFALSHVGMMTVVFLLAGAGGGSTGNIFIIILGNIFVTVFEGLIVGIQVLRLEFYELFGRYYTGEGIEFAPLTPNTANQQLTKVEESSI